MGGRRFPPFCSPRHPASGSLRPATTSWGRSETSRATASSKNARRAPTQIRSEAGVWDQGVDPDFCDTRESPLSMIKLVFGKPILLHHRSGHSPQPCSEKPWTEWGLCVSLRSPFFSGLKGDQQGKNNTMVFFFGGVGAGVRKKKLRQVEFYSAQALRVQRPQFDRTEPLRSARAAACDSNWPAACLSASHQLRRRTVPGFRVLLNWWFRLVVWHQFFVACCLDVGTFKLFGQLMGFH